MKNFAAKILLLSSIWIGLLCVAPAAYSQCAMCKKSAEDANDQSNTKIASSINSGVLYLLAMPYLAAGVVGIIWYRNQRKVKPE